MRQVVRLPFWVFAFLLPSFSTAGEDAFPRKFELDDLLKYESVSSAVISPDGKNVAVVTERPDGDKVFHRARKLWLVPTQGGVPRQIDDGLDANIDRPAWSGNGKELAYLQEGKEGGRLRRLELERFTATTVTACLDGETVAAFKWAPRGLRMAVLCNRPVQSKEPPSPIIVSSQSVLFNGPATVSAVLTLATIDFDGHSQRRVQWESNPAFLQGDTALTWSPAADTLWIAASPEGSHYAGTPAGNKLRFYRGDLRTGKLTEFPIDSRHANFPAASPDGRELLMPVGGRRFNDGWRRIWRFSPLELRRVDALTGRVLSSSRQPDVSLKELATQLTVWSPAAGKDAGGVVYFSWIDQGSSRIRAYHPTTQQWTDLTSRDVSSTSFSIARDGTSMAVVQESVNSPPDVYLLDLLRPSTPRKRLTYFGDEITRSVALAKVEHLRWRSGDDQFDVHGWLLKPRDFDPRRRHPLIVDIHGGPGALFGNHFGSVHFAGGHQVPPELYASRGYLVLMVNPRGDASYGQAYVEALREGWDRAVRDDILAGVDEVVRLGYADPNRLGIAGHSWGGWATAYAITQTDRFKAASANDPVIDLDIGAALTYRGPRSTNYWMYSGFFGALAGERPSLKSDPSKVNTPILLRFGIKDTRGFGIASPRTHPGEFFVSGLAYFTYLHARCKPVEMILHPEEGHGISNWKILRDYIARDLAWFDYWLKGEGAPVLRSTSCEGALADRMPGIGSIDGDARREWIPYSMYSKNSAARLLFVDSALQPISGLKNPGLRSARISTTSFRRSIRMPVSRWRSSISDCGSSASKMPE